MSDACDTTSVAAVPNLQDDDFRLFGIETGFAIERELLDQRWKTLQRQVHPDRFAAQGAAAQRLAMQWSVRVNEAYQRLKNPLKRAAYWCELQGIPVRANSNTSMPTAFLMQQMAWREALEEASQARELEHLLSEVQQVQQSLFDQLAQCIDQAHDATAAVAVVRSLMFVERFADELHGRLDRL